MKLSSGMTLARIPASCYLTAIRMRAEKITKLDHSITYNHSLNWYMKGFEQLARVPDSILHHGSSPNGKVLRPSHLIPPYTRTLPMMMMMTVAMRTIIKLVDVGRGESPKIMPYSFVTIDHFQWQRKRESLWLIMSQRHHRLLI